MTLKHRRIMYFSFFAVFFIVAPFLIMYAQGYKFDWRQKNWSKTGVLFLESKPTKADIFLDGKEQKDKTTARLTHLLPGEYEVKIVKEGFQAWQKKLQVQPNATTYAQYIRLFRQTPSYKKISNLDKIIFSQSSPDQTLIALVTQAEGQLSLKIYNLTTQQLVDEIPLAQNNYLIDQINWQSGNKKIILKTSLPKLQTPANFWLYDTNQRGQLTNLNQLWLTNPTLVKYSNFEDNVLYFYQPNQGLKKYNLITREIKLVTRPKLNDFFLDKNFVYYLENGEQASLLKVFSLADPGKVILVASLPPAADYQIKDIHNRLITLHSVSNQKFYLIEVDQNLTALKTNIVSQAKDVIWHEKKNILAWWNDFELWSWEVEKLDAKQELLTRVSSPIEEVIWYPVETHLVYLTNNKVRVIELIPHSGIRETTDIFSAQKITQVVLNDKGDKLYLVGQVENEEGLFEVEIQ